MPNANIKWRIILQQSRIHIFEYIYRQRGRRRGRSVCCVFLCVCVCPTASLRQTAAQLSTTPCRTVLLLSLSLSLSVFNGSTSCWAPAPCSQNFHTDATPRCNLCVLRPCMHKCVCACVCAMQPKLLFSIVSVSILCVRVGQQNNVIIISVFFRLCLSTPSVAAAFHTDTPPATTVTLGASIRGRARSRMPCGHYCKYAALSGCHLHQRHQFARLTRSSSSLCLTQPNPREHLDTHHAVISAIEAW